MTILFLNFPFDFVNFKTPRISTRAKAIAMYIKLKAYELVT